MKKLILALAALAVAAPSAQAASFVHVTPPPKKTTVQKVIDGKLAQKIECRAACTFSARLFLRPSEAERLGLEVPEGEEVLYISTVEGELEAGQTKKVYMPVDRKARRALKKSKDGAKLNGGAFADALDGMSGGASFWYRNCNWKRA